MPFPNFHSVRQRPPGDFVKGSIQTLSRNFPKGITALQGKLKGGGTAIQTIRFDRTLWTADRAKAWLKRHKFSAGGFEKATPKN